MGQWKRKWFIQDELPIRKDKDNMDIYKWKEKWFVSIFYDNETNQLKEEGNWKNGYKHGEFKTYYQSGNIKETYSFIKDLLDGEYKSMYENGQSKKYEIWAQGKIDGECKEWYENGQLKTYEVNVMGEIDGKSDTWYENGQPKISSTVKNGNFDGKTILYQKDGFISTILNSQDEKFNGEYTSLSSGQLRESGHVVDNFDRARYSEFYNGYLVSEGNIHNKIKSPEWIASNFIENKKSIDVPKQLEKLMKF